MTSPSAILPLAHEKWFINASDLPLQPEHLTTLDRATAVAVALVIAATCLGYWLVRGRRDVFPGPIELGASPRGLRRFLGLVPLVLALHLGIPLVISALNSHLATPNVALAGPARYLFGLMQLGIALALIYGALTRLAAVALAAMWMLGLFAVGVEPMLENIFLLGFAGFFWLAGRGPASVDAMILPRLMPDGRHAHLAFSLLRGGLGLSMVVLAFTEKLANPALAAAFLRQHQLNFSEWVGLPMSDHSFVVCAGCVELLVGLLVTMGVFPRPVILLAWVPFNASLMVFQWQELIGHLPFYGGLAVLLMWSATPTERAAAIAAWTGRPIDELPPTPPAADSSSAELPHPSASAVRPA
jgi:hypothetical protein